MRSLFLSFPCVILVLLALCGGASAQVRNEPLTDFQIQQAPYNMVGVVYSDLGRGSGVVIADRVVLTASHVLFDDFAIRFSAAPNYFSLRRTPTFSNPVQARGIRAFTDYATNARRYGIADSRTFDLDAACLFFYQSISQGAALRRVGVAGMEAPMSIVGYPAGFYSAGDPRADTMHATNAPEGIVTSFALVPPTERYRESIAIDSGAGNSGGPVFATIDGEHYVVGVYVSGAAFGREFAGLCELDLRMETLIASATAAVRGLGGPGIAAETAYSPDTPMQIRDGSVTGVTSSIYFGGAGTANLVSVTMSVTHTHISDLEIELTAPDGTVALLHGRGGGSRDNLVHTFLDVQEMAGRSVRGTWQLKVKDRAFGDVGTLDYWGITFSRPGTGGVAYASLVEYYTNQASNSYNYYNSIGQGQQALAALFYNYAFVGLYQSEADGNPALRDFSYYFFLAYYHLNYQYAVGDPVLAQRYFYNTLATAYYQFYLLSGYPGLAQGYHQYFAALAG